MKCQGNFSQKVLGGGGHGEEVRKEGSPWCNLHFTLALSIKSNAKLVAKKNWTLRKEEKSMTYLDILVILSAWLLLDSLYALTTTVSAVPPHFSTWTLHSGNRHIKTVGKDQRIQVRMHFQQ